jgi:hypothetical protein
MKWNFAFIVTLFLTGIQSHAQSINNLKQQYQNDSPFAYPEIKSDNVVEASATAKTPAEEALDEIKQKELAEKKAREEKVYLDTDYQFFQSMNVTLEEDELDKALKEKQRAENIEKLKQTDQTVKGEIKTTAPRLMTRQEGISADEKRTLILKKIAANAQYVKACIIQHKKTPEFKGTSMTLSWDIDTSGKVANGQMQATDVETKEIQACVLKSLSEWNFAEAMKSQTKKSHIEYTYRFVKSNSEKTAAAPATTPGRAPMATTTATLQEEN